MKDDFTNGCDVKADVPDDQKGRHYDVFEEATLIVEYLRKQGVLSTISERVRFVRPRFGRYEVIDFLAVQIALCQKLRTHAGSLLRGAAALCPDLHGLI